MDEAKLDEISETMRLYPNGTHAVMAEGATRGAWMLDAIALGELVRLARLGLWAEQFGIPAVMTLSKYHDDSGMGACGAAFNSNAECTCSARIAHKAFRALCKPAKPA